MIEQAGMSRYRPALALMAWGYLLAFLVWALDHFLLADAGAILSRIANILIWVAVAVATVGAVLFTYKFFKSLSRP